MPNCREVDIRDERHQVEGEIFMELYRFRPTSRVISDKELEDHYLFFAAPSQLNDPLEGFVDLYWQGDAVAWLGLFKHYVFQFFLNTVDVLAYKTPNEICEIDFSLHHRSLRNLPIGDIRKQLINDVCAENQLIAIANKLNGLFVSAASLKFILSSAHSIFLKFTINVIKFVRRRK